MKTEKKEIVETNTSSYTMDDTYHLLAQAHRNPQVKEDAYNAPTNAYLGNKSLGLSEEVLECKVTMYKFLQLQLNCISIFFLKQSIKYKVCK